MIEIGLKYTSKPSKIGDVVKATAEVTKVDGKKIEF